MVTGKLKHSYPLHERIRALEAELNDYRSAHAQEQEWRKKAKARVKEIEAENRILTFAMQKEIAKVRALEAKLAEAKATRSASGWIQIGAFVEMEARAEKAESDGRLLGKMLDAQNEKLQKAKARVKELEALPPGLLED